MWMTGLFCLAIELLNTRILVCIAYSLSSSQTILESSLIQLIAYHEALSVSGNYLRSKRSWEVLLLVYVHVSSYFLKPTKCSTVQKNLLTSFKLQTLLAIVYRDTFEISDRCILWVFCITCIKRLSGSLS